jgi:hypothetical protein
MSCLARVTVRSKLRNQWDTQRAQAARQDLERLEAVMALEVHDGSARRSAPRGRVDLATDLFTGINIIVFVVLGACVAAASILYLAGA